MKRHRNRIVEQSLVKGKEKNDAEWAARKQKRVEGKARKDIGETEEAERREVKDTKRTAWKGLAALVPGSSVVSSSVIVATRTK